MARLLPLKMGFKLHPVVAQMSRSMPASSCAVSAWKARHLTTSAHPVTRHARSKARGLDDTLVTRL